MANITFTYRGSDVTYGIVERDYGANGKYYWLDRNLGASRVATSSTDSQGYGELFQWGRLDDGHQSRTSDETSTLSDSDDPGHDDFITAGSGSDYDWRDPQNDDLWQGVDGDNMPGPKGWKIPTITELEYEKDSWSTNNSNGAYGSTLKWPVAGNRYIDGNIYYTGSSGYVWSSSVSSTKSSDLRFLSASSSLTISNRAEGRSVRCLRDSLSTPTVTTGSSSDIQEEQFTIAGSMTDSGGMDADELGFVYMEGSSGDPTTSDTKIKDDDVAGGKGTVNYSKTITGLSPETSYRVRAYAINEEGTSYGTTITVETEGGGNTGAFFQLF